ncbi:hypothetical protein Acor_60210 [Acrocarpospora corrugata]|uniref:HTH cro/C1-type domain-containing protein n=1 Tax=Acrocarpospora corrugata TaxID=35763 RepID=A0A5M3W4G5_9ACTN|nr:helix-turn-helix domain-containing protein [Acrocarpospora corrugata]GES03955.1 hypothetical protein Acor_60210 [Acrocarpospora corrugata]
MRPDPDAISTVEEFAQALTLLMDQAGLTLRGLAKRAGIPPQTVSDYLNARNRPRISSANLAKLLKACGITSDGEIDRWYALLRRLWRGKPVLPQAEPAREPPSYGIVSTRPPVERLSEEPTLVGRQDLLRLLGAGLTADWDGPRVHVLHGLGGTGKSAVALALVRWALERKVHTWWVTAADGPGAVSDGMRALAVQLGAGREVMRSGSHPDVLWRLLNKYRSPWLLVIDDTDDPRRELCLNGAPVTDATGWLRPVEGRFGLVVVTTRDSFSWGRPGSWARSHRIEPLTAGQGADVLRELAPQAGSAEDAHALAERLGGLPLALRLAGLHLAQAAGLPGRLAGPATFAEYGEALRQDEDVLDVDAPGGLRHRQRIDRTWELSLDLLADQGLPQARPLLRLLACFRQAAVPYGLLLRPEILSRSPLLAGLTTGSLRAALLGLSGVGLVDLVRDSAADPAVADLLLIHPLVRYACRRHARDDLPELLSVSTALLAAVADELDPKNPVSWSGWRALADHCHSPFDLMEPGPQPSAGVLGPATLAARYLLYAGRFEEAGDRYGSLLTIGVGLFGADHPDVLAVLHDLSQVRASLGRYAEAERGFGEALTARRLVLGPEHPDTLTTQHYLGRLLLDQGRLDQAEELLRPTLAARERVLGPLSTDTLTSKNNLAHLLYARNLLAEAEHLLTEVLRDRTQVLGADFPATLITRHYLALIEQARGRHAAALARLRELAAVCVRVQGPEHHRSLAIRHSLGEALLALEDRDGARSVLTGVLDGRTRVLGPDHPHTLATEKVLGRCR